MLHSSKPIALRLRCDRQYLQHLLESPISDDQEIVAGDEDQFELSATANDTQDLRWWLVAQGSPLDILEPDWLRDEANRDRVYSDAKMEVYRTRTVIEESPLPSDLQIECLELAKEAGQVMFERPRGPGHATSVAASLMRRIHQRAVAALPDDQDVGGTLKVRMARHQL